MSIYDTSGDKSYDPYRILGVSHDISDDELTKAYRKLAKVYHPDLNPDDERAAEKMSKINSAYERIKSERESGEAAKASRIDIAKELMRRGEYDEALSLLSEIPEQTAEWHCYSAIALLAVGDITEAKIHARAAVEAEPENEEYAKVLSRVESTKKHSRRDESQTMSNGALAIIFLLLIAGFIALGYYISHR